MDNLKLIDGVKLSEKDISDYLKTKMLGSPLYFFDEVTSTFDKISEYPRIEGLTVVAKAQTKGRGRLGRSWTSSSGGIYFSFNLKPDVSPQEATFATITCALGVVKALKKYCDCAIKWPNDIVLNGKKICGILTTMGAAENKLEYICVGIGINVNIDSFDSSLPYASSIKLETNTIHNENDVFSCVLESIEDVYTTYTKEEVLKQYCESCITKGSMVTVHYTDGRDDLEGECIGITQNGSLVVRSGEKTITVSSGEVSVRGMYGYV